MLRPAGRYAARSGRRAIGIAAFLLALTAVSVLPWSVSIPAAGAGSRLDASALARTERDVQRLAAAPHPIGSSEAARVRDYIIDELSRVGTIADVQEAVWVARRGTAGYTAARLNNIVARVRGRASTRPLLLVAHYDSPAYSPGAGDNGAGVAALLETVRQIKNGAPLAHDVIVLFTDGEEIGLLGARAFMARHPWARAAAVVLNFDARGTDGPSIMFETGDGDGWLLREFAKAAPHRFANSLAQAIYQSMPNDTDFTVFRQAGLSGLNFAFIDGAHAYHTAADTPARLARASLAEHVALAVALTRHLGNATPLSTADEDLVYFDVLGQTMVTYPAWWGPALAILVAVVFLALVVRAWRANALTIGGMLVGVAALPISAALAAGAAYACALLLGAVGGSPASAAAGAMRALALVSVSGLMMSIVYAWLIRRTSGANLVVGVLALWTLAAVAVSVRLPGASYLIVWPLAGALGAAFVLLARDADDGADDLGRDGVTGLRLWLLLAAAAPALILLPRMIRALYAAAATGEVVLPVLVVPCAALLLPQLLQMTGMRRWFAPMALSGMTAVLLVAAGVASSFGADRPKGNFVQYVDSADTGTALWTTAAGGVDEWTAQYVARGAAPVDTGRFPSGLTPVRAGSVGATAPSGLLPAPAVSLLSESIADDGRRTIRFNARSARQAAEITLAIESDEPIVGAAVDGLGLDPDPRARAGTAPTNIAAPPDDRRRIVVRYFAPPAEGVTFDVTVRGASRVRIGVADRTYGLPAIPGRTMRGRLPGTMPAGDASVVLASFVL